MLRVAGGGSGGGGGSGTVTAFAFTNANGYTGTVANATTTPALTLTASPGSSYVQLAGTSLTLDNTNTATYNGNVIATQAATATTITLNTGAALTAGFLVIQKGAGIVTIGGSATLTAPNGLSTSGPDTIIVVIPTGTDTYDVLAPPTSDRTQVVASAGTAPSIDMSKYNVVSLTLTANCAPTLTGSVSGQAFSVSVLILGGAGGYTYTHPTGTKWSGGTAPTLVLTAGARNWITYTTLDGGTTIDGFAGSLGSA